MPDWLCYFFKHMGTQASASAGAQALDSKTIAQHLLAFKAYLPFKILIHMIGLTIAGTQRSNQEANSKLLKFLIYI